MPALAYMRPPNYNNWPSIFWQPFFSRRQVRAQFSSDLTWGPWAYMYVSLSPDRGYEGSFRRLWQQGNQIRWKKRKIRAITPFKVIQGNRDRYQSKATCDFLLVINSNWHPISYRFGVIAAWSNFWHFAFLSPLGGLGTTYGVRLGLIIGNRVEDFLLVLIELFR